MDMSSLFAAQSFMGLNMGNIYGNAIRSAMGMGGIPMYGQQNPLFGGVFDPASVFQGLALNASGQPRSPSQDVYIRYGRMQENAMGDCTQFLEGLKEDVESKKDQVFFENHYLLDDKGNVGLFQVNDKGEFVTDKDGKLVPDRNGKPKLEKGGETYEQNKARKLFERTEMSQLKQHQQLEAEQLSMRIAAAQDAFQSDPSTILNTQKAQEYTALMESLTNEQIALAEKQTFEQMGVGLQGLPDPQDPTKTLSSFLSDKQGEYQTLKSDLQNGIETSAEYTQIKEYMTAMKEFTEKQKEAVRQFLLSQTPGFFQT